jgi:hypothetical protein
MSVREPMGSSPVPVGDAEDASFDEEERYRSGESGCDVMGAREWSCPDPGLQVCR